VAEVPAIRSSEAHAWRDPRHEKAIDLVELTLRRARGAKTRATGLFFPAIFIALLLVGAIPAAAVEPGYSEAREGLETLALVSASGTHEFSVEVMRTGPQRERGLMFRRFLPQDRGMLFIFEAERPVAMWMKNTYLPLDMIFIGKTAGWSALWRTPSPCRKRLFPPELRPMAFSKSMPGPRRRSA